MVFTMNTSVFALEVGDDAGEEFTVESAVDAVEINDEAAEVDSVEAEIDDVDKTASLNAASQNFAILSNNSAVSEDLVNDAFTKVTIGSADYYVVYPVAYAFNGKKDLSTFAKELKDDVKVYTAKSGYTVSDGDLEVSFNEVITTSMDSVNVKKVKVHKSNGATVDITGKGIVPLNKSFYISGITFDSSVSNKKELDKGFKEEFKGMKATMKSKTDKVSANGIKVGGTDDIPYTIAVYPAYAGTDSTAAKIAEGLGFNVVQGVKATANKKDASVLKNAKGTLGGKKVTLKPTKKPEKKLTGLANAGKGTKSTDAGTDKYIFETDGDYFGFIEN